MDHRRLMLIVLFAAVLGVAVCGAAGACECEDATSVTMGWPDGGPGAQATMGVVTPGQKQFACYAHADPTCNEIDLAWSNEAIAGVTTTWPDGSGVDATFKLQNLPSLNGNFGSHWVRASVDGKHDDGYYRLYFVRDGTDHPGGGTPNWYYYWKQTAAGSGYDFEFDADGHWIDEEERWAGAYCDNEPPYTAYICPQNIDDDPYVPPEGQNEGESLEGINNFAWTVRHECRHQECMIAWWPNGWDEEDDDDEDWLPDASEDELGGTPEAPLNGGPFDPTLLDTDADERDDFEDYTLWTQDEWEDESIDDQNWANPGPQY